MVAVAAVAVVSGSVRASWGWLERMRRLRESYLIRAEIHMLSLFVGNGGPVEFLGESSQERWDREREEFKRFHPGLLEYHEAMEQKYRRAALYPFLPIMPDQPAPK